MEIPVEGFRDVEARDEAVPAALIVAARLARLQALQRTPTVHCMLGKSQQTVPGV